MQKVAAYLLERKNGLSSFELREMEVEQIITEILKWINAKGATLESKEGSYEPEDGSLGKYAIQYAVDKDRSWWMLELREDTASGRRFSVAISVTSTEGKVSVYVTLETGLTISQIMPLDVDPKCPRIVRSLLKLPGPWYHGNSALRMLQNMSGFYGGDALVSEIENPNRTVPIVVVSEYDDQVALPGIDKSLAFDLAAIANVYRVDQEASWVLTDVLGQDWCCHSGAIRIFWPHFSNDQDRYFHPLWTADRLRSSQKREIEMSNSFRKQLRALLFRASALSAIRPHEIDSIRDAHTSKTIASLRRSANSLETYEQLANGYAEENQVLQRERDRLRIQVENLGAQVAKLESDRNALQSHLRAAKLSMGNDQESNEIEPSEAIEEPAVPPPVANEVRYYKKRGSSGPYDKMVHVKDCGHNNWQSSASADKARKGIARLETTDEEWKTMQHCGSCTGGGMWRVRW